MAFETKVAEWIRDKNCHHFLTAALKGKLDFNVQDDQANTYWHTAFMPGERGFKPYVYALAGLEMIEKSLSPEQISLKYRALNNEGYSPADILLLRRNPGQKPSLTEIMQYSQKIFSLGYQKPFYFTRIALNELITMVQGHADKDPSKRAQCWEIILVAMAVRLRSLQKCLSAEEFDQEVRFYCEQVKASGLIFTEVSRQSTLGLVDFIAQIEHPCIADIYKVMGVSPENIEVLVSKIDLSMSEDFGLFSIPDEESTLPQGATSISVSAPAISQYSLSLQSLTGSSVPIISVKPILRCLVASDLADYLKPFIPTLSVEDRCSLVMLALQKECLNCFNVLVENQAFEIAKESQFLRLALQSSSYELIQQVLNRFSINRGVLTSFALGDKLYKLLNAEEEKPVAEMINLFFSKAPQQVVTEQFSEAHCKDFMSILMTLGVSEAFKEALGHILRRSAVWTKSLADNTVADKEKFLALIKGFLDVHPENSLDRDSFLWQMLQDISVDQLTCLLKEEGYLDLILSVKNNDGLTMPALFLLDQPQKFAKVWENESKRRRLKRAVNPHALEHNKVKVSVLEFVVQRSHPDGDPSIDMLRKDAANFNSLMTWDQCSNLFPLAVAAGNAEAVAWLIQIFGDNIKEDALCRESLEENSSIVHALVARGEGGAFNYLDQHFKSIVDSALVVGAPKDNPLFPWQWAMIFGHRELFDRLKPTDKNAIQSEDFFKFLQQNQKRIVWEGWLLVKDLIVSSVISETREVSEYLAIAVYAEEILRFLDKPLPSSDSLSLAKDVSELVKVFRNDLTQKFNTVPPTLAGIARIIEQAEQYDPADRIDHILGLSGLPRISLPLLLPKEAAVSNALAVSELFQKKWVPKVNRVGPVNTFEKK